MNRQTKRLPPQIGANALMLALISAPCFAQAELQEASRATAAVDPYEYEILPIFRPHRAPYSRGKGFELRFEVRSTETVPGDARYEAGRAATRTSADRLDAVAVELFPVDPMPMYPETRPAKWLLFKVSNVTLFPDGKSGIGLHFKGAVEQFELRRDVNGTITFGPLSTKFCKSPKLPVPIEGFSEISTNEEDRTYVANNLSLAAIENGDLKWRVSVPFESAPAEIRVVGNTLLTYTANGHSLYVMKDDGEWVFSHPERLAGVSPLDEIIELAVIEANEGKGSWRFSPHIAAIAALEDECGAHFLIECIEKGFGQPEKVMAIAALERLTGNHEFWVEAYRRGGSQVYPDGMFRRVWPLPNRRREIADWREVFAQPERQILPDLETLRRRLPQRPPVKKKKHDRDR